MGRPAYPVEVLQIEGKTHLTKEDMEDRKALEIKLGDAELPCPDFVQRDKIALKKWKECKKIYECEIVKKMQLISSGDVGHLGRYCKTFAEYQDLIERREKIAADTGFTLKELDDINDEFEDHGGRRAAKKMWERVDYILSTGGIIAIDKAINQKMTALIAMEDRLFLNPASKIRAIPKKVPKEQTKPQTKLEKSGFGDI